MKRTFFVFVGMILCLNGFSQEIKSYVISSTGASIMGENGALYLSIGEPMNTEISGGEIMISQGFLQVSIAGTSSNENILDEEISVYPNPTSDQLFIEMPDMNGEYRYQLFNSLGADIVIKEMKSSKTMVDLNSLESGTYFLKVNKGSKSSKTLKIVKL